MSGTPPMRTARAPLSDRRRAATQPDILRAGGGMSSALCPPSSSPEAPSSKAADSSWLMTEGRSSALLGAASGEGGSLTASAAMRARSSGASAPSLPLVELSSASRPASSCGEKGPGEGEARRGEGADGDGG